MLTIHQDSGIDALDDLMPCILQFIPHMNETYAALICSADFGGEAVWNSFP